MHHLAGRIPKAVIVWINLVIVSSIFVCSAARMQSTAIQPERELTVERIWGRPSLDGTQTEGLEWSPDGKLLSYFQSESDGSRELWALDVATGERRKLVDSEKLRALLPAETSPTQATGLGRVRPKVYQWAPKEEGLVFASEKSLAWLDLKSGAIRQLVNGDSAIQDPKISPDGRSVSFVRDYNLWLVSIGDGREKALTEGGSEQVRRGELDWVYPEELAIRTAYWWSPDSSRIAYLEMDERPVTDYPYFVSFTGEVHKMRYPAAGEANPIARVGVVSASGGSTTWMDTGDGSSSYLARVAWLPDGRQLAIERLNRAQNRLELLVADASNGRSRVVLTEEDKYWVNLLDDPYFLDDGRFLWLSERSGFSHVYLYDGSGKMLNQVTRGDWIVTDLVSVDEKQRWVYFVATEKTPMERHLYRIRLDGTGLRRLTEEDGTHTIDMAPNNAAYLDTYSNTTAPPRQDVYHTDGTRLAVINENRVPELASYHLAPVRFLTVSGGDGVQLNAMMIKPPNCDAAHKCPVIVNTYGGPGAQVVRNAWGGGSFLWHQMMAQKGYIIFALDNRGTAGRGHIFETPVYHHFGQMELADQLAGVRFLRSLPYVDGSRVGIWGWSYGGHMTLHAMFEAGDAFKAGFAGAPVTDWRLYDTIYTERYMGTPDQNPDGYKNSSPLTYADKLKGKLLIAHGTGDDNVKFANSVSLDERFIQSGRYAEIMIFPGRGHPISDRPARIQLFRRVTQFFLDNL